METKNQNVTKLSKLFWKSLRDFPSDADTTSLKLLVKSGYIRRVAPGVYTWLPLGLRILGRIEKIVREEMNASGADEVHFPALMPKEPYDQTGRWDEYGDNIFRLEDRHNAPYLLAPTHEEAFAMLAKDIVDSYKQLPLNIYQIQTKYRDEARPRAGLLRCREFVMKDAYSFDLDPAGLQDAYALMRKTYARVFDRLGIPYVIVKANSGPMGGSASEEFLCPIEVGEDTFAIDESGNASNVEALEYSLPCGTATDSDGTNHAAKNSNSAPADGGVPASNENVPYVNYYYDTRVFTDQPEAGWVAGANRAGYHVQSLKLSSNGTYVTATAGAEPTATPDTKTIDDVAAFFGVTTGEVLKSVALKVTNPAPKKGEPAESLGIFFVPGNRELDEKRLEAKISPLEFEIADDEFLKKFPEIVPGYIGPKVDSADAGAGASSGASSGAGANAAASNVRVLDFAEILEGDLAPNPADGAIKLKRGVEIAHIFALGQKYTKAFDVNVLDANGKATTLWMGSYGIGVSRAIAVLSEFCNDEFGLVWPAAVAPFDLHIVVAGKDEFLYEFAGELADLLADTLNIEVLVDDRTGKVSPGVKFKDAELIGVPTILTVGKDFADGFVELKDRKTGEKTRVSAKTDDLVKALKLRLDGIL
jgi:prolyl-tRNA synthetase